MKRLFVYVIVVCLCLSFANAALSGDFPGLYNVFKEEKAAVMKNGTDVNGQAFRSIMKSENLLVLAGDLAFMLDVEALTVHDVAINSIKNVNEKDFETNPIIDYDIISEVVGAGLKKTDNGGYAFTAKGDLYEVRLTGQTKLDWE